VQNFAVPDIRAAEDDTDLRLVDKVVPDSEKLVARLEPVHFEIALEYSVALAAEYSAVLAVEYSVVPSVAENSAVVAVAHFVVMVVERIVVPLAAERFVVLVAEPVVVGQMKLNAHHRNCRKNCQAWKRCRDLSGRLKVRLLVRSYICSSSQFSSLFRAHFITREFCLD
jgi:hypothetical protein